MPQIAGEQKGQRRHARRNHELLVAAAREVFAEQGVDASLEEVARRAGVGIGTLYRHFTTREALVEAIVQDRIGELVSVAAAAAAEVDGWRAFVSFLERTLELQAGDRLLKDVLVRHARGGDKPTAAQNELRRLFERVLERAREQRTLRDDFTLSDLALLLWSFRPVIDATAEVAPQAWRRHLHWLLDGLRADAATPAAEPPLSEAQLVAATAALRELHQRRRHPSHVGAPATSVSRHSRTPSSSSSGDSRADQTCSSR